MNNDIESLIEELRLIYKQHDSDLGLIEVEPEYVYITIPAEYVCIYNRLLILLSDYGLEMLKECKAACSERNIQVIECFNMFNAAIAAHKLNLNKEAETIIKYVEAKLNMLYKKEDNSPHIIYPIDDKGYIKALVTCGDNPTFTISKESGLLLAEYIKENKNGNFSINETSDLTVNI